MASGQQKVVKRQRTESDEPPPAKKKKQLVHATSASVKKSSQSNIVVSKAMSVSVPKDKSASHSSKKETGSLAVPNTPSAKTSTTPAPAPVAPSASSLSTNWLQLQKVLGKKPTLAKKRSDKQEAKETEESSKTKHTKTLPLPVSDDRGVTKYVALDCEMVGIENGESMLGRVCMVNSYGNVIYDKYVLPQEKVLDYRTKFSGIQKHHLTPGNAVPFKQVQTEVAEIIKGRIVVGHALHNDFKVLFLSHPFSLTRDTAKYRPFLREKKKPHALKTLVQMHLGITIQGTEHAPDEDARAAMLLYKLFKKDWEQFLSSKKKPGLHKKKKPKLDEGTTKPGPT